VVCNRSRGKHRNNLLRKGIDIKHEFVICDQHLEYLAKRKSNSELFSFRGVNLYVRCLAIIAISLLLSSCVKDRVLDEIPTPAGIHDYSFFVAGHTYGAAGIDNEGLHPPFVEQWDYLNTYDQLDLGFLTGDIVSPNPTVQDWIEVDRDLADLDVRTFFAVGNHDMENRPLFEERYGSTYYSFTRHGDLFIVLDPNIDAWSISGDQLTFLQETLTIEAENSQNIFVFFHQMIWWESDTIFSQVAMNSSAGRGDDVNFWNVVYPKFDILENEVYMFCGDLGAGSWSTDVMYWSEGNTTFIGSGMGDGPGDNYIIVDVDSDGVVNLKLIALGDDPGAMGELEDWTLE